MSRELNVILTVSLVALVGVLAYWIAIYRRAARPLPLALLIGVTVGVVILVAPNPVETRGSIDETASIVLCYFAMLLGMCAEYGYAQAERGNKKLGFELMTFLMPIFASPIVFIPLLTITTDVAAGGGAFTRAKLMVYLVAFQNGFFWKKFFEERRQAIAQVSVPQAQPAATESAGR